MILTTDRLILRPLVQDDHADIQKHFPHWDIVKYLSASKVKWPYPEDGAYKFLKNIALPAMENGADWYWGITTKENPDEVIGVIHLRSREENGNRSFWISGEHQGKGYMTEVLEAVNDFAFDVLGFEKLVVKNAHANAASHQLKQKTGAEFIGVVKTDANHYIGGCEEQEIWHITRWNWRAHKQRKEENAAELSGFRTAACKNFPRHGKLIAKTPVGALQRGDYGARRGWRQGRW